MDNDFITSVNTEMIRKDRVKWYAYMFCAAVKKELLENKNDDINAAYYAVRDNLISFSEARSKINGVCAIDKFENILSYLFNQKNALPAYISYWLMYFYDYNIGDVSKPIPKYADTYNALQKLYINNHRFCKHEDKKAEKELKSSWRKISKMYRSGVYSATFNLYGKPLKDIFDKQELEDISKLLNFLYVQQIDDNFKGYNKAAVYYMMGRIQGRNEAKGAI